MRLAIVPIVFELLGDAYLIPLNPLKGDLSILIVRLKALGINNKNRKRLWTDYCIGAKLLDFCPLKVDLN